MNTENQVRAFIEDLIYLKEKHNIPAITGIVFIGGKMAPFKMIGRERLITVMDETLLNRFALLIANEAARIGGSPPTFAEIKL